MDKIYGGIEAGGTKFICLVASGPEDIRAETRIATLDPDKTLAEVVLFFQDQASLNPIKALGVACFGPLDLDPSSPGFGSITTTPKAGWENIHIVKRLESELHLPVTIDTDVNAAAFGEYLWGAPQKEDPLIYLTVGTGIGGGVIVRGKPVHGLVHPEMGHLQIPHDWQKDPFPGVCPYHGDCFEGLACGGALNARFGQPAELFPADHPAWDLEAGYIAAALVNLTLVFSPRKIILGGGVMQQSRLFPLIQQKVLKLLNNYVASPVILEGIERFIIPPGLGNRSGVLGAIALARELASSD
jgi:fructokinase